MRILSEEFLNESISLSNIERYPFKHLIVPNFLPESFLSELQLDVTALQKLTPSNVFDSEFGVKKEWKNFPESLPHLFEFMNYLKSDSFCEVLKSSFDLPGSERLIPDETYDGGGFVISPPGAYLTYHADFNYSNNLGKYRVLNVLYYFNEDYEEEFGGKLHLLDSVSKTVEVEISPKINTILAFLTDDISFHGVSRNAAGFSRKSFNLYFYADSPLSADQSLDPHKTIWIQQHDHHSH